MTSDIHDFEKALLSSRDDFISRQNKSVDQAREQFGSKNVKAKKIERPAVQRLSRKVSSESHKTDSYKANSYKTGYIVRLAVRKKRIAIDEMFEHRSDKLSKLEAQLDAEKAARKAGYPIIGYVYSMDKL